ncbi:MAG: N-acetyltransferase family protein [Pseudobdellovibrionaceae bacterium]
MSTIEIYQASEKEAGILGVLHVEGWHGSYDGIVDADYVQSVTAEMRESQWTEWMKDPDMEVWIAYVANHPVGFVSFGTVKTNPPGNSAIRPLYSSEIYGLYIIRNFWGQGVGRALMQKAALRLKERKHTSLCLWVLEKNKNAIGFYEKMGGQRIGKQMRELGPHSYKEVCYGWRHTGGLRESDSSRTAQ